MPDHAHLDLKTQLMPQMLSYLSDTWRFFSRHALALCLLLFPVAIPIELLKALLLPGAIENSSALGAALGLNVLSMLLYQSLGILYISSQISGKALTNITYYQQAIRWWTPLLLIYTVSSFAVFLGLLLLIIPGLILLARLSFADYYCVLEKHKTMDSLVLSWKNTQDYQWPLLLGTLLISIFAAIPSTLLDNVFTAIGLPQPMSLLLLGLLSGILMLPLTIFKYRYFTAHQQLLNTTDRNESEKPLALTINRDKLLICLATEADKEAIVDLHKQAFGSEQGEEIATLVAALLDDQSAEPLYSFVTKEGNHVIAHALFSKVKINGARQAVSAHILAPMAVAPSYQRHGLGQELINDSLAYLTSQGLEWVFVLGDPAFYTKCNFKPAGLQGLDAPHPIPEEHSEAWMVQQLNGDKLGRITGQVQCSTVLNAPQHWQE